MHLKVAGCATANVSLDAVLRTYHNVRPGLECCYAVAAKMARKPVELLNHSCTKAYLTGHCHSCRYSSFINFVLQAKCVEYHACTVHDMCMLVQQKCYLQVLVLQCISRTPAQTRLADIGIHMCLLVCLEASCVVVTAAAENGGCCWQCSQDTQAQVSSSLCHRGCSGRLPC